MRARSIVVQVANLWLIIIGGSIINRLDGFVDDPASIVDLLGASVPTKSQVNYYLLMRSLLTKLFSFNSNQ